MAEPQVAALLVRRMVEQLVEHVRVDREELLARAGVAPSALALTRLRLPWAVVEDLIEAAEELSGDDRVGLHLARTLDLEDTALPGLLFFASRTLDDAMRRLRWAQRLWSDAYVGRSTPGGFTFELLRPERRACVHLREHAMATTLVAMRQAVGQPLAPVEVAFVHDREHHRAELEGFFRCPVRFGAPINELKLTPEQRRLPLVTAHALFSDLFERQAREELARLPAGTTLPERVRELLVEDLEARRLGEATVEELAERLRTSPRTLQRELARAGTSFAAELELVRRRAAEELLLAGRDIAEISWHLGYADPAVFHRAFKRWTGETPQAFRQARR